jgi:hypothetical protein
VFTHLLEHLQKNDHRILDLLRSEITSCFCSISRPICGTW